MFPVGVSPMLGRHPHRSVLMLSRRQSDATASPPVSESSVSESSSEVRRSGVSAAQETKRVSPSVPPPAGSGVRVKPVGDRDLDAVTSLQDEIRRLVVMGDMEARMYWQQFEPDVKHAIELSSQSDDNCFALQIVLLKLQRLRERLLCSWHVKHARTHNRFSPP